MSREPQEPFASKSARRVAVRELRPIYVVQFIRGSLPLILLVGLGVACLYWGVAQVTARPVFQSACSLIVTPVSNSSTFRQAPLSVTAYKQLLDSQAMISETKRRLVLEKQLLPGDPLRLGRELRSRVFLSLGKNRQGDVGVPMIELIAEGPSAEVAAWSANAWAAVFLKQNRALVSASTKEAISVFEKMYPVAQEDLKILESEEVELAAEQESAFRAIQDRTGTQVSAHRKKTLSLVTAYTYETHKLEFEMKMSQQSLQKNVQLEALKEAYLDLQRRLARVDDSLAGAEAEKIAVRRRLEGTPRLLALRRVSSEEPVGQEKPGRGEAGEPSWTAEEVNPIYVELDRQLAAAEVQTEILGPEKSRLLARQEELSLEIEGVFQSLEQGGLEFEQLVQERSVGQKQLELDRKASLQVLKRREGEMLSVEMQQADTATAQLKREIGFQLNLYKTLQKSFTDAALAREQMKIEDVRLSTKALAPDGPLPQNRGFKTLIAFFLGAAFGFFLALARAVLRAEELATA